MGTVPHLQPSLLIDDGTFEEMAEDEEALDANRILITIPSLRHSRNITDLDQRQGTLLLELAVGTNFIDS